MQKFISPAKDIPERMFCSRIRWIKTEADPVYGASVASRIAASDTANWNNKQDQLTAGTGIDITNNVVSTKNDFYLGQDTLGYFTFKYCLLLE